MNQRVRALLLVALVVVGFRVSRELYRWYAFAPERAQVGELREQLVDAGAEVIRTETRADTLQEHIEGEDHVLTQQRRGVDAYGRYSRDGRLPDHLYTAYRTDLRTYNRHVEQRNARVGEWKKMRKQNRAAVSRYNTLADSIRRIANRIGEPYLTLPLPAEAAVERGIAAN